MRDPINCPNWNLLTTDEKVKIKEQLISEYQEVQDAYTDLVRSIKKSFEKCNVAPEEILIILRSRNLYVEDIPVTCSLTLNQAFMKLIDGRCTSWCYTHILRITIEQLGSPSDLEELEKYESILKPYLKRSIFAIPYGPESADNAQLHLKIVKELMASNLSISDITIIRNNLRKLLDVPTLEMGFIEEGCVELVFVMAEEVFLSYDEKSPLHHHY